MQRIHKLVNPFYGFAQQSSAEMGLNMKKIVYKSRAIQAVIIITALCLLVSLWPLRIWHEKVTSSVGLQTGTVTEVINEEKTLLQGIVAQYDHMDTISVYLGEESRGESFYLRILDEQWQQVCEEKVKINPEKLPGFQDAMIDIDMEVGKMYYVILQGDASEIFAGYEMVSMTDMPYLGTMYYADSTVDGASLAADYHYSVPLRKTKVALFGILILAAAGILYTAVTLWYKKKEDKLITVERAFRSVANPIVAVGVLVGLITVVLGLWGRFTLDNTVYFVSILLLGLILFYGINHSRDGMEPILTPGYLREHAGDLLQSAAIAGAIAGCCEYVSGLYDIHHTVAERKEMFWFAIAIIAMFKWKEILNLYTLGYFALAGIAGWRYYQTHLPVMDGDVDDLEMEALKYLTGLAILLGFIVLRTLAGLFRRRLAKPAWYAALLGVFFALIILFRNGRWWGVAMAAAFTLFYLNYGMWEHKDRILVNIARGVIFQFVWSTGYALLHRPYVSYRNARYTHIFHTVTITAAYLTMVECAAVVILLSKLQKSRMQQKNGSLKKDSLIGACWKELTLFGVVSSYMLFTMARTAFFSVGVAVLFALIFTAEGKGKEKLACFGRNLGLLILAVLVCFPVTFTAQRNIPALVSEPFLYEIEYSLYCPEDVMRGRRLDTINYMRVGRFIDVFAEKIFGLPEGTFDVYGELALYQELYGDLEWEGDARAEPYDRELQRDQDTQERKIPGIADSSLLVASADYIPQEALEAAEKEKDYTNGRLDIFRSYIEQLNLTGHEEMGALLANGEIATHAHNIYLQVAYDHGIGVGIVFVLVGIATFAISCLYYSKKKDKITYAALPAVVTVAVGVAGMVEWVFHLSNPCGFLLMLVITPLVFKNEG